jgi:hypothetical protein
MELQARPLTKTRRRRSLIRGVLYIKPQGSLRGFS